MLIVEYGSIVLVFAGAMALVALRQARERPESESQDDPTSLEDGLSTFEGSFSGWAGDCSSESTRVRFVALRAPENACLNTSMCRWRSERVFADIQKERVAVTRPANPHAGYIGKGGECEHAFREQQDPCLAP